MLTLRSGASSIVVAPKVGAGQAGCTPVVRRTLPQASADGDLHALGRFPAVALYQPAQSLTLTAPECRLVSH